MHRSRFKLSYPNNRSKRSVYDQLARENQLKRTKMATERMKKYRNISRKLAPVHLVDEL